MASPAQVVGMARVFDESARVVAREDGVSVLQRLRCGTAQGGGCGLYEDEAGWEVV